MRTFFLGGCSDFEDIVTGVCRRVAVNVFDEDTSSYNLSWASPVNGSVDIDELSR
jgi:hypothetical protein